MRSAGPPARLENATPCQRRSRRGVPLRTAASSTRYASTALGRLRTAEVLGVVILDAGLRSSESDEILLDFAAAYGHAYKREVVSVASPATLERAVRGCTEEGASKIMVVPYLLSSGRNSGTDLPSALADVQLKMPGIRCIIGETIDIQSLLSQQIENSVKAVDAKAPEPSPERYWRPEAAMPQDSSSSSDRDAAEALPIAEQRSWSKAVQGGQAQPRPPSPAPATQQAQQTHTQPTAAQQPPITVSASHLDGTAARLSLTQPLGQPGSQPAASAGAATATATGTANAAANTNITINLATAANATVVASSFEAEKAQPAPAAAAAAAPAPPPVMSSWSDDFTVAKSGGVTVNDYRSTPAQAPPPAPQQQRQQQQQQQQATVAAAAAAAATVIQANSQSHAASSASTSASASASSNASSSAFATAQSSPEPQQASVLEEAQEAPTLAASAMTLEAEWDAPAATSAPATSAPATSVPATTAPATSAPDNSAQVPSSRKAATASRPMRSTWDRTTSRLVALSAIPTLFLSLPLLMSPTATLALGAVGWAALSASLIGVCASALLFSFHSSRGEVTAAAVQGQGLMIGLAAIAQMCIGGSLPASVLASLAVLAGVQAVVFASPTVSERLSSSVEGRWLQGAWTRAVGTLGLATAAQALWPAVQARLSTLPETKLALVTGSAALAAVAIAGGSGLPPSARRSAWPAAAFFLLQPASLALTMSAVSPSVAGLAMIASALTIPRALWTNNQLWVAGSVWGTMLGFGQLMVSTGVGLHMPLLSGFAAALAGGCALANYCSFRERLAPQAL